MNDIEIHRIPIGNYKSNSYLVFDKTSSKAIVVDCCDGRELQEYIENNNLNIMQIKYGLLTHGHFDHVSGVKYIQEKYGTMFFIGREDLYAQEDEPYLFPRLQKVNVVYDGSDLNFEEFKFKAIATPGHTKGGMCYKIENHLFTGDTLFKGTIGRTDLYGGDFDEIIKSINEKLLNLPDDTIIYPGHGTESTIGEEKNNNEFLIS